VFVALLSLARSLERSVALAISLSAINNNNSLQRITAIHGGRDQRCSFTQPQQQGNKLHTLNKTHLLHVALVLATAEKEGIECVEKRGIINGIFGSLA